MERLRSALNIAKFSSLEGKPMLIERVGGVESLCVILESKHAACTYARLMTKGTLAKVLLSKFEDTFDDTLLEIKQKEETSTEEAEEARVLLEDHHETELECLRHAVNAVLYLITGFRRELAELASAGWGGNGDICSHPFIDAIERRKEDILKLVHTVHKRMLIEEDAFCTLAPLPDCPNGIAEQILQMLESPKTTCMISCSLIVKTLSTEEYIEQFMESLGSMDLHANTLDQIVAAKAKLESLMKSYSSFAADRENIYNKKKLILGQADAAYTDAATQAKRGLKHLKEAAARAQVERNMAQEEADAAHSNLKAARFDLERGLNVERTFMTLLKSTIEAIGAIGLSLHAPKQLAIDRFVVDELIVFARTLNDHDEATVLACGALRSLAYKSKATQDVVHATGGIEVLLELFRKRSPYVKAAATAALTSVLSHNTVNIDVLRRMGALEDVLTWIEDGVRENKSDNSDICETTKLLAVMCSDPSLKECQGLDAIQGDRGLTLLLSIICTGNRCANLAALALSNCLSTSNGPESASRVMETGGLTSVCTYLKSCRGKNGHNTTIVETLKVVRRCCERYRPDAQNLAIETGIFPLLIDWACSRELEEDIYLQVEAMQTLRWMTLDNHDIQMQHDSSILSRGIMLLQTMPSSQLNIAICRWVSAVVENNFENQNIVAAVNGFEAILCLVANSTLEEEQARGIFALSVLVTENDALKQLAGASNSILNVIQTLQNHAKSILLKCSIARFIWKVAEKHSKNRASIYYRDGVDILCSWCHEASAFNPANKRSPTETKESPCEDNELRIDDGDHGTRLELERMCVYALMSMCFNDVQCKSRFISNVSLPSLCTFITHCRGITQSGFAMLALTTKLRGNRVLVAEAVRVGAVPVLASELYRLAIAALDPAERSAHEVWAIVNCACKALEVIVIRNHDAQMACVEEHVLQTMASILIRIDAGLNSPVPIKTIVHVLDVVGEICRGNQECKQIWKDIRDGPEGVRRWSVNCERDASLRVSITNILAYTSSGYDNSIAENSMNITLL